MSITAKKILIIVTKGEIGGAQVSVLNLAKGLKEKGVNAIVNTLKQLFNFPDRFQEKYPKGNLETI